MIEVSVFGWLVWTLSGGLSVVFLVTALLSVAYVATSGAALLRTSHATPLALPAAGGTPAGAPSRIGIAMALAVLVLALSGIRVGTSSSVASLIATCAVGLAAAVAAGATASCLGLAGARGLDALSGARRRQRALKQAHDRARALQLQAAEQRFLQGHDLRDEVLGAEASLQKLSSAIGAMEDMRTGIARRIETAPPAQGGAQADPPGSPVTGSVREEYERLLCDLDVKVDLGRRVLVAAEAAAFRLACAEPLRTLLRRRPSEALKSLGRASGAAETETQIAVAARAVQAFVDQIPRMREALSALSMRRPAAVSDAPAPDGAKDPLNRARLDLEAIESAYRTILERIEVTRLRFATRTEMEQVARAAGSVTASAEALGHGEGELGRLIEEISRAESAITMIAPENASLQAFTDALARSAVALEGNDTATLADLIEAMREIG